MSDEKKTRRGEGCMSDMSDVSDGAYPMGA